MSGGGRILLEDDPFADLVPAKPQSRGDIDLRADERADNPFSDLIPRAKPRGVPAAKPPSGATITPARGTAYDPNSSPGEFLKALYRTGVGQNIADVGSFVRTVGGERVGSAIEGVGKKIVASAGEPKVGSLPDIHTPQDAADYAAQAAGSGVGSSIPSYGATVAGSVGGFFIGGPAGAFAGGTAAGFATSYIQNVGQIRSELEELKVKDPATVRRIALGVGIPVAALDVITPDILASRIVKRIGAKTAGAVVERIGVKGLLKEVAVGAASEAITEPTQEALQYYGTRLPTGRPTSKREAGGRMAEAAVQAGLTGGLMGGAEGVHGVVTGSAPAEASEPATAPEQEPTEPEDGVFALEHTQAGIDAAVEHLQETAPTPITSEVPTTPNSVVAEPDGQEPPSADELESNDRLAANRAAGWPDPTPEAEEALGDGAWDISHEETARELYVDHATHIAANEILAAGIDPKTKKPWKDTNAANGRKRQTEQDVAKAEQNYDATLSQYEATFGSEGLKVFLEKTGLPPVITGDVDHDRMHAVLQDPVPFAPYVDEASGEGEQPLDEERANPIVEAQKSVNDHWLAARDMSDEDLSAYVQREEPIAKERSKKFYGYDGPGADSDPEFSTYKHEHDRRENARIIREADLPIPPPYTEKGGASTIEEALFHHLAGGNRDSWVGAAWAKMKMTGATDEQIKTTLAETFGIMGGRSEAKSKYSEHHGGKNPRFSFRDGYGEEATHLEFKGKKLVNLTRELLQIPEPGEKARVSAPKEVGKSEAGGKTEEKSAEKHDPFSDLIPAAKPSPAGYIEKAPGGVDDDTGQGDAGAGALREALPEGAQGSEAREVRPPRAEGAAPERGAREGQPGGERVRVEPRGTSETESGAGGRAGASTAPAGDRVAGERAGAVRDSGAEHGVASSVAAGQNIALSDADAIGAGGLKEKADRNVAAIRLLKELEAAGRVPTLEEQRTLARYVGWGGLPAAFDQAHKDFARYGGEELKSLLTKEEYEAARASTPNAHYTSPTVIRSIYNALKALHVPRDPNMRILEPSMGVGHFIGFAPELLRSARWTGAELDSVTGRIARLLYPKADIHVKGFEQLAVPDGTFDLVVGNVPFGAVKLHEPRYNKLALSIHNHFIVKSLDLTRPGGVVAVITSAYTLDSQTSTARQEMAKRGEFIGAIRLPEDAFLGNANTKVVTDIIFFRRKAEGVPELGTDRTREFLKASPAPIEGGEHVVNEYFQTNPKQVVGAMSLGQGNRGMPVLAVKYEGELAEGIARAAQRLPQDVYISADRLARLTGTAAPVEPLTQAEPAPADWIEGQFGIASGQLVQKVDGALLHSPVAPGEAPKVKQLVQIRDAYLEVLRTQRQDESEEVVVRARKELNKLYDRFVKQFGPIAKEERTVTKRTLKSGEQLTTIRRPNLRVFAEDPSHVLLSALEKYDYESGKAEKRDALLRRVIDPHRVLEQAGSPAEALPFVLAERARVDLADVARLSGVDEVAARKGLAGLVYENPETGELELADRYLSGDVKAKLAVAKSASRKEPRFKENIEALEKVQPKDLPPSRIWASLGANWIPGSDFESFADHALGAGKALSVARSEALGLWKITAPRWLRESPESTNTWGTSRANAVRLLEDALNQRATIVYDPDPVDPKKRVVNPTETLAAQEKQEALKSAFTKWLWDDQGRSERLARIFNDRYNRINLANPDGSHLTFPGAATHVRGKRFELRAHQRNAVWRVLQYGNTLLAHVVGAGKTAVMVMAGMEAKRTGIARKPLYIVPNHMLYQFAGEFQELYPNAQLLVATKDDLRGEDRRAFVSKASGHNWDAILMTHRSAESVPMSPEFQRDFIEDQIRQLEAEMRATKAERGDNRSIVKELETAKKNLTSKLQGLLEQKKDVGAVNFEDLGVDMMFVDEAHLFKNLQIVSKIRGQGRPGSQRAFDLLMKSLHLDKVNPGRGLVFATGTPISNSISEVHTMMRYLQPRLLKELGLEHFDDWVAAFAESSIALELNPTGGGYRMKGRFRKFKNVGRLAALFRQVWDVQSADMLKLPHPPLVGGKAEVASTSATPWHEALLASFDKRAERIRRRLVDPSVDNFLKITTEGRHAGLDARLVDASASDRPDGKLAQAAERIASLYDEHAKHRGVQLVFSDISAPGSDPARTLGGVSEFNAYDDLKQKLVEKGIPGNQIAFIHEGTSDDAKERLFRAVREGRIRVLLGSTEKMGAGMNVQNRLVAEHHLDAPWRPSDIEQREGRILRQGNELFDSGAIDGVRIFRYIQEKSFDAYLWQTLETKAGFIDQVMRAGPDMDEVEDVSERELSFSEIKAIASGDPRVQEKAILDARVAKLEALERQSIDERYHARAQLAAMPARIKASEAKVAALKADAARREVTAGDNFKVTIDGKEYTKRAEAGAALKAAVQRFHGSLAGLSLGERYDKESPIGKFAGFPLSIKGTGSSVTTYELILRGEIEHDAQVSPDDSPVSLVARLERMLDRTLDAEYLEQTELTLDRERRSIATLEKASTSVSEHSAELRDLKKKQETLDRALKEAAAAREAAPKDESPDVGSRTLYSVTDPLSAAYVTLKELKRLRAKRDAERAPLVEASLDEIEERWQAAKGAAVPTMREKVAHALAELAKATHHFPELNPATSPIHALVQDLLLEVEHSPSWAKAVAHDKILDVVQGLTPGEVDLMSRSLVLNDIEKDIENGLYQGAKELPFGYTPDALNTDLAQVEAAIEKNGKVKDALSRRSAFAQALTRDLVSEELLPSEVLRDDRYYHRQVMAYLENRDAAGLGLGGRDVRVHKKGFQRERVGGTDFNTAYAEAEFEWVSQALQQLHTRRALKRIEFMTDIKKRLVSQARSENAAHFEDKIAIDDGSGVKTPPVPHPLDRFRNRIGWATRRLYAMLERGLLEEGEAVRFEKMLDALDDARAANDADNSGKKKKEQTSLRFDHPDWFPFLSYLVDRGGDGAKEAATIFKAIREREAEIKATLGREYATWEDLIPEGYSRFQPEKGNYFYKALSVEQKAFELALESGDVSGLKAREVFAMGAEKPTWVVPQGIAATMEDFGKDRQMGRIERGWTKLIGAWKWYQLLRPARALRYNLNNLSGDFDGAILYPRIMQHVPEAAREIYNYLIRKQVSGPKSEELRELQKLRVIGNTISASEIGAVSRLPDFRHLVDSDPQRFMGLLVRYAQWANLLTQARENVLRLAAYRYFLKEIQAGRGERLFASSNPDVVRAERGAERRAAVLSRDLLGDYGAVSSAGTFVRERLFPFWSWQEINFKRYVRFAKNVLREGGDVGRGQALGRLGAALGVRTALGTAKMAVKAALLANLFMLMAALWNRLMFPEDEKAMRNEGRTTHIILGHGKDGAVLTVRIEGAFADFLGWVGLKDYPADVEDLLRGTATVKDKLVEMAEAPINRIASMWEPVSKTFIETLTRRSLYPDAFKPRLIRDPADYVASQFSLQWLYRKVTGKPARPSHPMSDLLVYRTEPGEAAYYAVRDLAARWLKAEGKEQGGMGEPTERANALYYWKKAAQWGDDEAAARWYRKYRELGGTRQGARSSVRAGDPLQAIPHHLRGKFLRSLDARDRAMVESAREWFRQDVRAPERKAMSLSTRTGTE